jgi:hypothetical protein
MENTASKNATMHTVSTKNGNMQTRNLSLKQTKQHKNNPNQKLFQGYKCIKNLAFPTVHLEK